MGSDDLERGLVALLDPDRVALDEPTRDRLARTTLPTGTRPLGVVQPVDRDEVRGLVEWANRYRIGLYPYSAGRNWGYGDGCAPRPAMLVVDLRRMNRIVEVNRELAYAIIEPGVTHGQLSRYLRDRKIPLVMDIVGSGPDTSFVGTTLERGFGHSYYGDRFGHSCHYEVVLGTGEVITTGAPADSIAADVYRYGTGPFIDGLFTQANFGIVTRMTVWLMPRSLAKRCLIVFLKAEESAARVADTLRTLFLQGTLRSAIHVFNDGRMLGTSTQFPWDRASGLQALRVEAPELHAELLARHKIPAWVLTAVVQGDPKEVAASVHTAKRALRASGAVSRFMAFRERDLRIAGRLADVAEKAPFTKGLAVPLRKAHLGGKMFDGIPDVETLRGAHWRARAAMPASGDPLDSGSGLIWLAPVFPMSAEHVRKVLAIARPIIEGAGFEFLVSLGCVNPRTMCAVLDVDYDRTSPDETARAERCASDLLDALLRERYVPYRAAPWVQERLWAKSPAHFDALARLKAAWDPHGVISPGRYVPDRVPGCVPDPHEESST